MYKNLALILWLSIPCFSTVGLTCLSATNVIAQPIPVPPVPPTTAMRERLRSEAEAGNLRAQSWLGQIYYFGEGVPVDYAEAAKWLKKAADQSDAMAQYLIGMMYYSAQGVPQDYVIAADYFQKAANQGDIEAQNQLGQMYEKGQGVPLDFVKAYKWQELAASNSANSFNHGIFVKSRDNLAQKMTPSQIAEGKELAKHWMENQ